MPGEFLQSGFYRHFDSKDQIVAQACMAAVDSLVEQLAAATSGRADEKTRTAATEAFLQLVGVIASQFDKTRPDVARRRALAAAATMIGALTLSRVMTDSELSAGILQEAEKQLVNSR